MTTNDKENSKKLRFVQIEVKRQGQSRKDDPYSIVIEWTNDDPDAQFALHFSYCSSYGKIPDNHRVAITNPKNPNEQNLDRNHIPMYKGNSIKINDWKYDGAVLNDEDNKGDKTYCITVECLKSREKISWEIKKYWEPDTNPHSEGDVIRPPFGGG
jgi:hypothetical protein